MAVTCKNVYIVMDWTCNPDNKNMLYITQFYYENFLEVCAWKSDMEIGTEGIKDNVLQGHILHN
jgi:hypothetical protein